MDNGAGKDFVVSWDELHRNCRALAWRLNDRMPFKGVLAITRGGLVPAAIVARELNIRVVDSISISSYDHKEQGGIKILKPSTIEGDGEGWLIVDDLVDTGKTAKVVRELYPAAHFATVYAKPAGRDLIDTYITEVSQDTWIVFPWDANFTYSKPFRE